MAFTNSWEESQPPGTQAASLGDNRIRDLKLNLGERLEDMLYGFNVSDGADHEALYGVKKLLFRELSADPTIIDTDNELFLYTKDVGGKSELFYKDNADSVKQLTSAGKLNVLDADGAVMKTGDQTIAGVKTLASPVINTAISGTAILDEDNMASDSDTKVATQQSIKKFVDNEINDRVGTVGDVAPADYQADSEGDSRESFTHPNGKIEKSGYIARTGVSTVVTFDTPFPNGVVSAQVSVKSSTLTNSLHVISAFSKTAMTIKTDGELADGYYWKATGY